jgi:hypothetical protein
MAAYIGFKKLCKNVGLDSQKYALHSPRIGAAMDAHLNGLPDNLIDFRGRWKSSHTKKRYCRPEVESLLELRKKTS